MSKVTGLKPLSSFLYFHFLHWRFIFSRFSSQLRIRLRVSLQETSQAPLETLLTRPLGPRTVLEWNLTLAVSDVTEADHPSARSVCQSHQPQHRSLTQIHHQNEAHAHNYLYCKEHGFDLSLFFQFQIYNIFCIKSKCQGGTTVLIRMALLLL